VDWLFKRISSKLVSCQGNSWDSDCHWVGVGVGAAVVESVGFSVSDLVGGCTSWELISNHHNYLPYHHLEQ
jgi:hypothetical protein